MSPWYDPGAVLRTVASLALLLAGSGTVTAQEHRLVDRVVAVVDDEPILSSDVDRVIRLGLVEVGEDETEAELRARVLQRLVEQRLRMHAVDRYGFQRVPIDLVDEQIEAIAARFDGEEAFEDRLTALGMDREDLRQLVTDQLQVLIYVEELLGARVFVGLEEIRAYYDEKLVPRLEKAGEPVPPLDEVREEIRTVLREEQINRELERWTEELRRESDVVIHEEPGGELLPPVVATEPDSS